MHQVFACSLKNIVSWLNCCESVVSIQQHLLLVEWIRMGLEDQVGEALEGLAFLVALIIEVHGFVASSYPGKLNPSLAT
jgi:hypothetical protein